MARLRSFVSRLYSREGFRGPVVTLLSGTAVTLAVSYLAVPILTRLFTPAEFGTSDYFVTMVSVLITFASLRYEDAMMLPEEDDRARAVFWLALGLAVVTSAVLALATIWSVDIAAALRVGAVAPWLWMLAPAILLMRFSKLIELWLTRQKAFRTVTGGEVTNKIAMLSARIGTGSLTALGAGGLIGGYVAGQVASSLYYAAAVIRSVRSPFRGLPSRRALRFAASRYRRFPLFAMPSSLLNAVVARLPVLLLPVFFGLETVGLFGRAFVALAVPLSLIGTAVSHVFFIHAAEAYRDGRLSALTENVHARLVMIGAFPTVLLLVAGPELFAFVFGAGWREAGVYEQYLACWFFLGGIASPLTRLFDVLERQRTELLISIAASLTMTAAIVAGGRSGSILLTMALIAAAGSLVRLFHIGTMLQMAAVPFARAAKPYLIYASISVPLVIPVLLVRNAWPLWATALLGAALCTAYYSGAAWSMLAGRD
jgi:O-antigen/teichoic acid export membrane protein